MKRAEPQPETHAGPSRPQHWSVDPACWRNYCEDLIYAAAQFDRAPGAYLRQIERRRPLDPGQRSAALRAGEAMHEALLALWPEAPTGLALARFACGDDLEHQPNASRLRRDQQAATCARCARWLPKPPPTVRQREQAERDRRAGITEAQRQANAEELAARMGAA